MKVMYTVEIAVQKAKHFCGYF